MELINLIFKNKKKSNKNEKIKKDIYIRYYLSLTIKFCLIVKFKRNYNLYSETNIFNLNLFYLCLHHLLL